jgi:hypothetical protein
VTEDQSRFRLSSDIEHFLAALSKFYAQEGERQKLEIIVNSQVRVHEEWSYDNWDGGMYGHALYLTVPEDLYLGFVNQRTDLQNEIKADINKIHNVQNEFIDQVFLEMEKVKDRNWRRDSGALQSRQRSIPATTVERIWGEGTYRVFLSHKTEVKIKTSKLKQQLEIYGVSAFVAHQDIHPTKEWQDEIENALASMDAFVALLTEKFHESLWTDQEVGYALGRGVPLIAVKFGKDPYGFIGKFQALACDWEEAPLELVKLLMKQPRMLDAYIKAVQKCDSFEHGNLLSKLLSDIESLTEEQARTLVSAFNHNSQLQGSFGFSGERAYAYGRGLAAHLSRITGRSYIRTPTGEIEIEKR